MTNPGDIYECLKDNSCASKRAPLVAEKRNLKVWKLILIRRAAFQNGLLIMHNVSGRRSSFIALSSS
ncbi:MAG: hypothetical protein MRJ65_04945 [Candidatus Brocadiaceae bacterium]|nr:hypothetical protein [Candidatus Brocadiaceae bacterium]